MRAAGLQVSELVLLGLVSRRTGGETVSTGSGAADMPLSRDAAIVEVVGLGGMGEVSVELVVIVVRLRRISSTGFVAGGGAVVVVLVRGRGAVPAPARGQGCGGVGEEVRVAGRLSACSVGGSGSRAACPRWLNQIRLVNRVPGKEGVAVVRVVEPPALLCRVGWVAQKAGWVCAAECG